MANVIACYKWVLDEAYIVVGADASIDLGQARGKISDYDRNTIQMAVELAGQIGGRPVGMTCGDTTMKQSFQGALARGLEEAYWVTTPSAGAADGVLAGQALAAGIKQLGDTALVLCSEGSSDVYGRQTAGRVAASLDLPLVSCASKIWVEDGKVFVQRKLEDIIETVQVEMPAVIAVLPEATLPGLPSLRALVAAAKKPTTTYEGEALGLSVNDSVSVQDCRAFVNDRKGIVITEEDEDKAIQALVSCLKKEGVL